MYIRRLMAEDLCQLADIYKLFWGEDSSLDNMRLTFDRLKDDQKYILLVAEQPDGCIAGSVMGIICDELYGKCKPFMVIEDMIVDKRQRRLGVGTALMQALEQSARDYGCSYVIFVTEADRIEAHRFYESLGYQLDTHQGFKKSLNKKLN